MLLRILPPAREHRYLLPELVELVGPKIVPLQRTGFELVVRSSFVIRGSSDVMQLDIDASEVRDEAAQPPVQAELVLVQYSSLGLRADLALCVNCNEED